MQEAEQFNANRAEAEARSYRPEIVEVETWTKSFIEERHEIIDKSEFKDTKGVLLDDTKLRLMKGTTPRGQEVTGAVRKSKQPFELVLQNGKTVERRG